MGQGKVAVEFMWASSQFRPKFNPLRHYQQTAHTSSPQVQWKVLVRDFRGRDIGRKQASRHCIIVVKVEITENVTKYFGFLCNYVDFGRKQTVEKSLKYGYRFLETLNLPKTCAQGYLDYAQWEG